MRGRSLVTIVSLPLVVVSRRSVVPLLPVPVLSVPVVPVPVLVVSLPLLVPWVAVVVVPVVSVARRAVVISVVSSVIVAGGRPPVVVPVPLLVVTVLPLVMSIAMISATSAAAFTKPETGAGSLAVVEVDPGSGSVGGVGDGEVNTDLES